MNLRLKLIGSYIFIILVTLLIMLVVVRNSAGREVRTFMMNGTLIEVNQLIQTLEDFYQQNDSWEGLASFFGSTSSGRQGMGQGMIAQRILVADKHYRVVYDNRQGIEGRIFTREEQAIADALYNSANEIIGYVIVGAGFGQEGSNADSLISRLNGAAIQAGILSGGVAILIGLVIAFSLFRPLLKITNAAKGLARGDLSQRVSLKRGNDELSILGQSFNQMAENLEQASINRKSMTADIAHELRTPLAIQRAHIEAIQDGVSQATPETMELLLQQNMYLTRLVEDLRTLALADAGELQLAYESVVIGPYIRTILEKFTPAAKQKDVRISAQIDEQLSELHLFVDPIRFEQILVNILSNGLRYSQPGNEITIIVKRAGGNILISIRDQGPGIPEKSLEKVFDRFYRSDQSRSRDAGGSGLGLAIARQLVVLQGGTIKAENHPEGGALFLLSFPIKR